MNHYYQKLKIKWKSFTFLSCFKVNAKPGEIEQRRVHVKRSQV